MGVRLRIACRVHLVDIDCLVKESKVFHIRIDDINRRGRMVGAVTVRAFLVE